jgi:CheY-like chemotaxis protein
MARVVSVSLDAARVEGVLSTGKRCVTCREAVDAAAILWRAGTAPPDLVVLSGNAARAADVAEALVDAPIMQATALVAWRVTGGLGDTSRLVALGVRIVTGEEDAFRSACEEVLDAREGRTMRVDAPAEVIDSPREADLHGRRVVVADDDPAIRWFFADLLRAQGCDVEEAEDGAAALDRARRTAPDLIVSDIRMPHLDGVTLCRALRADPILGDVPLILLSWKEDWLRQAEGSGVGASAFLGKRSTPEEALLKVQEVLEPHGRLERRLHKAGPVRGRLDGTAPYRLLRLAGITHPDSRLTVRCALNAYEIRLREGVPRAATRVCPDGTVVRGAPVLGALLGERTGRFNLAPEQSALEADLEGGLHQQIAGYVARSRRGDCLVPALQAAPPVAPAPAAALAPAAVIPVAVRPAVPVPVVITLAPHPEAGSRTVPLAPRPVALRASTTGAARAVAERTLPLIRSSAPRSQDRSTEVQPRRRTWQVPLRLAGVAAVAALGIVLGAGVRALRQASTPAAAVPVAAAPGR